jgi:hypothetical protein
VGELNFQNILIYTLCEINADAGIFILELLLRMFVVYSKPETLRPKPQIINAKPYNQTLNLTPQTRNPEPGTLNSQPCTLNPEP